MELQQLRFSLLWCHVFQWYSLSAMTKKTGSNTLTGLCLAESPAMVMRLKAISLETFKRTFQHQAGANLRVKNLPWIHDPYRIKHALNLPHDIDLQ
jgi:hypothetical protein